MASTRSATTARRSRHQLTSSNGVGRARIVAAIAGVVVLLGMIALAGGGQQTEIEALSEVLDLGWVIRSRTSGPGPDGSASSWPAGSVPQARPTPWSSIPSAAQRSARRPPARGSTSRWSWRAREGRTCPPPAVTAFSCDGSITTWATPRPSMPASTTRSSLVGGSRSSRSSQRGCSPR